MIENQKENINAGRTQTESPLKNEKSLMRILKNDVFSFRH
jgi:hypothetical protein